MRRFYKIGLLAVFSLLIGCKIYSVNTDRKIWSVDKANVWYSQQPWLVGANFIPSNAINQIEMWQDETFSPELIDKELGYAESLGMNTMRIFLHDLVYQQDEKKFIAKIDQVLELSKKHRIKPVLVFFDSCWDPYPKLGKQRDPKPFTHNSGWVQSPGLLALKDSTKYPRLERYVKDIISHFKHDDRILGWDVWNEPDNMTGPAYEGVENPDKVKLVMPLLLKSFEWARESNPSQPITSGIWVGNWENHERMKPIERLQIEQSDVISFHNYDKPADFEKKILQLLRYKKPILCTEYMARPNGSTFEGFLPISKKYKVGMYNWGFVSGKSQTIYPWDSWTKTYSAPPELWFHDIFNTNGTPYNSRETEFIKNITIK